MSTEAFRAGVVTLIKDWMAANHPTVPVAWENGPAMDQDKVGPVWLDVEVRWLDGDNVTVGERPRGRDLGAVATTVYHRLGSGTQKPDKIIDGLRELLRNRRAGGGRLEFPRRSARTPPALGWYRAGLLTPFTLDSE